MKKISYGDDYRICDECGKKMYKGSTSITLGYGTKKITIEGIEAYKCEKCDNEVIEDKEFEMIENVFENIQQPAVDMLNLKETADLLRVSNQTVYNMIHSGRIKAYKIGRSWQFIRADIQSFIMNNENNLLCAAKGGKMDKEDLEIIEDVLKEEKNE